MKKILILFFTILISISGYSQFTGSGTYADPYSGGTLKTDQTWSASSSPIYVSGDLTIGTSSDAGHLTIEAGVTVRFCTIGADLIITGLGQLTSDGTSTNLIRFTADTDKDGIYGETGETWGHISLQSMGSAGASSITFCIIEFGRKAGTLGTLESVGGGLQVDFNNISISDNIFEDNYAFFGGAIFINASRNPSITRCIFKDNSVREAGGAVYLYNSCSTTISNCIFDGNYSKGQSAAYYSGGAIQLGSTITAAKIINSCFVNNTSDRTGDAFYTLSGGSVINSIFWGSSDQTGFYTSNGTVSYSGIQGYVAGSHFSNCFNLNSSNSASDGPNFKATDGSDWSIKVISPCRDAGTTPSPTVPTDYAGNSRVGVYDIGAYEVQYNGWKTTASTSDWSTSSNWDLGSVPGSSTNVVIPSSSTNFPVGSSYTIGSGYGMVLEPGAQLTMTSLTISGDLKLRSNSSAISSLITNSAVTAIVEIYLSGGGSPNYKWHYISSSVSSIATSVFTGTTSNLAQYVESLPVSDSPYSLLRGWIAYDTWSYYLNSITGSNGFSSLDPGKGYNYYYTANKTYSFSGTLNTSDPSPALGYSGIDASMSGFNLLGNPFPCGLDWQYIIDNSYPDYTSKALYFTKDNAQCAYISGVSVPLAAGVSQYIPPMQGFFVKTYSTGNTIYLSTAARTHNTHSRYKGEEVIPLVRLSISENETTDETVVRFDEFAKSDLDYDFDAVKMFSSDNVSIYSSLDNTDYVVNGQPFPEEFVEIPIVVNITQEGNHTITATQLLGLDDYTADLIDNVTGFTTRLSTTPVLSFSSATGLITDRFVLKISNIATAVENPIMPDNTFNIYQGFGLINIQTIADVWNGKTGSVKVLDLAGKTITDQQNTEFSKNSLTQIPAPNAKGLYIVEIRSGMKRFVGKVVIK